MLNSRLICTISSVAYISLIHELRAAPAADVCAAVFADGVNDKFLLNTKSSVRSDVRNWFCSDSFVQYVSKDRKEVSLEIPLDSVVLPFKFGSSNDASMDSRQTFCHDNTRSFSEQNALNIASSVASNDKINGWLECHRITQARRPSKLIQLDYEIVGDDGKLIVVTAKWNHLEHTKAPLVKGLVTTDGLKCSSGNLKKGEPLTVEGVSDVCTRDPGKAVSLTLETTAGFVFASLPASTCGAAYGRARLVRTVEYVAWKPAGRRSTVISTGDHHCERKCRGEPTRTNYKGELSVGKGEELTDPTLVCISGPCGGWNQIIIVQNVTPQLVRGSLDVWSRPTTWELSAAYYKAETQSKTIDSDWQSLTFGKHFTAKVDKQDKSAVLEIETKDGSKLVMSASDSLSGDSVVKRVGAAEDSASFNYTYDIVCKN